ncbi:MAG: glycosyltransferase [Ignavibacteriales bacterium]|nr:MAG: glycosyltransferase [Ignavibacteriales bacterium]
MFKVLVIAYYFPPMGLSGVQRTLKFTKYLKKYNWEPTVITASDTGYFAHDNSLLKEADEAGIRILRTKGNDPNSRLAKFGTIKPPHEIIRKLFSRISQTIYIPDNKISWSRQAFKLCSELLEKEKFDLIFVTGPPFSAFTMAAKLKKKFNIPLFVDYRDLWFDSYHAFYPTPYHKYLNKKYEYQALKAADRISVTNRKIKEKLINTYKFLTFEDIVIISHGFDPEDFEKIKADPKPNRKMILTYSGIFYSHITPKYFLLAFKQLTKELPHIASEIELHFVGHLNKTNQALIKKLNLEEFVKDFGYLNHNEAVKKILSSDVLWMMLGRWKNSDHILPGKLFEYIGARKPFIVSVPDGAARSASESYGAAFITEPDDVEKIKNTIAEVYHLYTIDKLPLPDDEYISKHRRDYLTEQLAKQFQGIVKTGIV